MKRKYLTVTIAAAAVLTAGICLGGCGKTDKFTLNKTEYTMEAGSDTKLSVVTDGNPNDMQIEWSSSNDGVAQVKDGKVTAIKAGDATVTATAANGTTATCEIKVEAVEVENVTMNKASVTLKKGKTEQLKASVYPENAGAKDLTWTSSDEEVALVNSSGLITAKGKGTANITASSPNGKSASCTVTVKGSASKSSASGSSSSQASKTTVIYLSPSEIADRYPSDFVFPYSSESYLSEADVAGLTSSQAQKAINEIYVREGHKFKNGGWTNYFRRYSWYTPYRTCSDSDFNAIERANIKLLSKYR